jgi:hypothetical protein
VYNEALRSRMAALDWRVVYGSMDWRVVYGSTGLTRGFVQE